MKISGSQPEPAHGSETIDSDSYHHGVTFICLCPDFPLWKKALYLGSSYSMVLLQLTTILGAMTILDKAVCPLDMRMRC